MYPNLTIFQFEANRRDAFVRATRTVELIRPQFGDFIRQISGNLVRGVLYFGVAFTTKRQEFIVLCNYLTRRAGEVDGESTNLTTQVVNVRRRFLGRRFSSRRMTEPQPGRTGPDGLKH